MTTRPSVRSMATGKKKRARDDLPKSQSSRCHKTNVAIPIPSTPSNTVHPSSSPVKSADESTALGTPFQSDTVVKLRECEVGEDTLNQVMHDIPGEEKFVSTIRAIRKSGQLLHDPTHKRMPARISAIIDNIIDEVCMDPVNANLEWAWDDDPLALVTLTNEELLGENVTESTTSEISDGRKLIGHNIDPDQLVLCSRFSMMLRLKNISHIYQLNYDSIPHDVFPREGESSAYLVERLTTCLWLDEIWKHKGTSPLNNDANSKQPCRRTVSRVVRETRVFDGKDCLPGFLKLVTTLYVYPCAESPQQMITCRPMKKMEEALIGAVWREAWPYCNVTTRGTAPNAIQICVYHGILGRKMGPHRDNNRWNVLKTIQSGTDPRGEVSTHGGLANSQQSGSNVIIFSMGSRPMTMSFRYPTPHRAITQNTKAYVTCPDFCMQYSNGFISILDDVDDMMMLHEVYFEKKDEVGDAIRIAWIMRKLENRQDFYADSSTLVRTESMRQNSRATSDMEPKNPRGVLT